MGSMGGIKYSTSEMFRINSFASVKNVCEACHVPTRPRTPRVLIENQTYNYDVGVYCCNDQMIVEEKDSNPSKKHSLNEDFIVADDDNVDLMVFDDDNEDLMVSDDDNEDLMVSDDGHNDFIVSDDDYKDDYKEEESCSKKRQKKVPRKPVLVYNLPSELPQNLQEYISGLNLEAPPLFVAQKLLTPTDVTSQQSRLLLPRSLINAEFFNNFLTEVEKELLETKAIEVNLVDDRLRVFKDVRMKRWISTSSNDYVLQKVWNKVVKENNLEPLMVSKDSKEKIVAMRDDDQWKTDVVALVWCFRRGSKIWLAFHTQAMAELDILGVKESDKGRRYIIV